MSSNPQVWKKWLLAGGLLLVLVYGLFQIPEVRGRSPESLWEIKITQLERECVTIGKRLTQANDYLDTLKDFPGKTRARSSWDNNLRLAQKNCLSVGSRVQYLDAKLAALRVAIENRIPGAGPALTAELNQLLDQIKAMELQSGQYRAGLESAQARLRMAKLARARQK